jgi:hypothetical protein
MSAPQSTHRVAMADFVLCSIYSLFNFIDMHYVLPVHIQVKESEKSHYRKSPQNSHVKIHIEDATENSVVINVIINIAYVSYCLSILYGA